MIQYADLSDTERRILDRARRGGWSRQYGPDEFPDTLGEHRYVEHRGRLHPVVIVVADTPEWELSVEEVDTESDD